MKSANSKIMILADIANNQTKAQYLEISKKVKGKAREHAEKFILLLNISFVENHSPSYYASTLNIHGDYLREVCMDAYGFSPSHLIYNKLVHEACTLLSNTNLYINEIAYQLNFSDPSYFSRFFKKRVGYSPKIYRSLIRVRSSLLNQSYITFQYIGGSVRPNYLGNIDKYIRV